MDELETDELTELLLLAANEGEIEASKEQILKQKDTPKNTGTKIIRPAEHGEGVDSSDEEDLQNFETKYSNYGREINQMIKAKNAEKQDSFIGREVNQSLRNLPSFARSNSLNEKPTTSGATNTVQKSEKSTASQNFTPPMKFSQTPKLNDSSAIYTDPIFGIRIIHPLISSTMLKERMVGRTPVDVRNVQFHLGHGDLSKDWCISGVIVNKSAVQTSQKGAQYVIWKISDLKGEIQTVSVFLFKNAFKELWKTSQGMVIAILNPSVFSKRDGNSEISLSVDNPTKVMILGKSKDFGMCKSKKKNGEPCSSIVNLGACEYCVYHVKQEYSKLSRRSELQSATSGRGLKALQNKVLGKNEVFYAGKSFTADTTPKSRKHVAKDQQRLMSLSDQFKSSGPLATAANSRSMSLAKYATTSNIRVSKIAEGIDTSIQQRTKDLERLKKLGIAAPSITSATSLSSSVKPAEPKFSTTLTPVLAKLPSLSKNSFSFTVDLNTSAKSKAIETLKKKPIEKSNPNFIKYRGTETGKKRALEQLSREEEKNPEKKQKLDEAVDAAEQARKDKIKKILEASSSHTELIKAHELSVQDEYFGKLEKKEMMEEKMLNTMKVECKAVICLKCKYKAFSAAPRCKDESHPLKVVDAEKRFYECENCTNRVVTLFRIPKQSCSNCQSSKWKRTGMIRDKKCLVGNQLSIRGDEETFIGNLQTNGNLNLCVAEE